MRNGHWHNDQWQDWQGQQDHPAWQGHWQDAWQGHAWDSAWQGQCQDGWRGQGGRGFYWQWQSAPMKSIEGLGFGV